MANIKLNRMPGKTARAPVNPQHSSDRMHVRVNGKYNISSEKYRITLLTIVLIFWTWSGIGPHDTRYILLLTRFATLFAFAILSNSAYTGLVTA